jgi:hypothetical protein
LFNTIAAAVCRRHCTTVHHQLPHHVLDEEVEVVISWEALLKWSPVCKSALNIFRGKANKAAPLDVKHTMLLNIVSRPWEEYFLRGSSKADNFMALKKQSYAG